MTIEELEAKLKNLEKLEARLKTLEDIDEINKLQRAYGYYLEHWEAQQLLDVFSNDPNISADIDDRVFVGKEGIKRFYLTDKLPSEYLHALMQLSGIVDVDPDGKTAKGRWYGFGCLATPTEGVISAKWCLGVYENEYVKENGKWKFKKLHWNTIFSSRYEDGWVKSPRSTDPSEQWGPLNKAYPSGYVLPYHYKNPVNGR